MSPRLLLLVDGSALMHRAYYALPGLTDRQGRPTGALYGFIKMLLRTIKELKPTHVAVAFDRREPTFRKSLYVAYQAQRQELDEALGEQFGRIRELLIAMNVPVYDQAGYEADDVIGSIVKKVIQNSKFKIQNYNLKVKNDKRETRNEKRQISEVEVIILTGDKDLMQLVDQQVKLCMPIKGVTEVELVGPEQVSQKLGVGPELIVDYKALTGDQSDNYPGVPGVGPKTAVDLLARFGSFAGVYDHLSEIASETLKAKLTSGQPAGQLSRELAAIKTDLGVPFTWETAEAVVKEPGKLARVLEEFGFQSLVKQLNLETISGNGEQLSLV